MADRLAIRQVAVEVGDTKQADFFPQAKSLFWNNDANFSARLVAADYTGAEVRTFGEVTEWAKGGKTARFYPTPVTERNEYGGFEVEVEFASRPASNVVTYTIQTKNLEFFRQEALTKEEIARGDVRPENVVGSYAVYHSGKADNEYKTGKAFHIYRPSARDAAGHEVWCDLYVDERAGTLSITVPQEFLDTAVYPVIVDPTLGYTSVGGTGGGFAANQIEFHQATAGSSGTLTDIQLYGSTLAAAKVTYGVYADSAGVPGSLLYTSAEVSPIGGPPGGWQTAAISGSISNGTVYWLAFRTSAAGNIAYDSTTPSGKYNTSSTYVSGVMPSSPPSLTNFSNVRRSLYANYTASSGSTGTSATTNANDTSSASGTTTVLGASATTNANDTSSSSGTTTVLGASATTNADDASSASGSVGGAVVGTSATTNANDTSAASGTTTVTGASAGTNANDQSSASGWAGTVSGTSATTNNNDTSSAQGAVTGDTAATGGGGWWFPKERKGKTQKQIDDERRQDVQEALYPPTAEVPVWQDVASRNQQAALELARRQTVAVQYAPIQDDEEEELLLLLLAE